MRRIINGKMYNTDTAKLLASSENGLGRNDFGFCCEDLYQKKTGEFFLYGEGGPNSKYCKRTNDNCWTGSERITPLSEGDAREWMELHAEVEEYIAVFGEPEE